MRLNSPRRFHVLSRRGRGAATTTVALNALGNYISAIWLACLALALIPVYFEKLGSAQWGLVAICMTAQGVMTLLDLGLSQVMPRDIARTAGDRTAETHVFRVYAFAYLGIGAVGCVLGQLLAPIILSDWVNQGDGAGDGARAALSLVFVQFLFQFANNASLGYWNGLQRQYEANIRQCTFATLKHAAALTVIFNWHPTAIGYLAPFATVSAIEWLINRRAVTCGPGYQPQGSVVFRDLSLLVKSAGVVAVSVFIGMMVSQADRVILSRQLDLALFGQYVIITSLGLGFLQLQYPLMRALFPFIVREQRPSGLLKQVLTVSALCIVPCLLAAFYASAILNAWLGEGKVPDHGATLLQLILLAVCVNALYHLIYQYIVKDGAAGILIGINLAGLVSVTLVLLLATSSIGIRAGGLAWLTNALLQLGLGTVWMVKRNRRVEAARPERCG